MLIVNPDVINSCRICRSPNQDGDYECLYQQIKHEELPQLSEAGKLYENLLDISLNSMDYYPQFLCNSCDLQMKLFKKLKDKAMKTLEYLQKLYKEEVKTKGDILNEAFEIIEDHYINEGGESISTNIEQNYMEQDMQRMLNDVDEIYVVEQDVDFIAKDELLKDDFINQNEILQTFQEDRNFESLAGITSLTALTKEELESITANNKPDKQYDEARKLQITFNNAEEPYQIPHQEVLEEYANSQTGEILQTFQEENFESLPSLSREEVKNTKASDKQYYGEHEMHTIFNNVKQPNVVKQGVNRISEKRALKEYANSQTEKIFQTFQEEENFQSFALENQIESQRSCNINYENPYNEGETLLNDDTIPTSEFFKIKFNSQDSCSILDKSDYVTEIYELIEDDSKTIQYSETSEHLQEVEDCIDSKAESSIAFSDIEYIESTYMESNEDDDYDEINEFNPRKKRKVSSTKKLNTISRSKEYQCGPCQQEFETSKEYKQHRSLVHNDCYPCTICSKLLKTQKSLYAHMRMHNSQPIQCEICQKTFNQKVHYQYHMNRHNNVRNFKCEECNKAFITKTDLKVHMRFHTGQRSYICDICGKSYLMMEHLKAHSITHTEQKFQCELCQQKFATHKTLKQHMKTIHEEVPKFKCNVCLKPFRRKHHLEYHSTLHQKAINLLDTHYELVEETEMAKDMEYVKDDFINQVDFIDDPGFVALNDEEILM